MHGSPTTISPSLLATALALLSATAAMGQHHDGFELEAVEEGVGDLGPAGSSLRHLETGLGIPTDFADVYRVPGRPDLLMRANGGLYAVFPRSQYAATENGLVPLIPNNTVFHIGRPALMWNAELADLVNPLLPSSPSGAQPDTAGATAMPSARQSLLLNSRETHQIPVQPMTMRPTPNVERRSEDADEQKRAMMAALAANDDASMPSTGVVHTDELPSEQRIERRVEHVVDVEAGPDVLGPPPAIMADTRYRHRRLRDLLRRAAERTLAPGGAAAITPAVPPVSDSSTDHDDRRSDDDQAARGPSSSVSK